MTQPEEQLEAGAETYARKNDDYGDSWRLSGELLYEMLGGEPITLETKEDMIMFGLFTRRMDKLVRTVQGEFLDKELNYEKVQDNHRDEMVYAAMTATLSEEMNE